MDNCSGRKVRSLKEEEGMREALLQIFFSVEVLDRINKLENVLNLR
jgi:hypothetical protein